MLVHNLGSLSVKFETVPVPGWQKEIEGRGGPLQIGGNKSESKGTYM